jgi:hypothetical protein
VFKGGRGGAEACYTLLGFNGGRGGAEACYTLLGFKGHLPLELLREICVWLETTVAAGGLMHTGSEHLHDVLAVH